MTVFIKLSTYFRTGHTGGTAIFEPQGRLVFAHETASLAATAHALAGPALGTVGVLVLADARDNLTIASPVAVLGRVENAGTITTNNNLTLNSSLGQQAGLLPVVPGVGLPLSMGTYVGDIHVQVYVDGSRNAGLGYRHLSSPVSNATIGGLATGPFVPVVNPDYNSLGNTVQPFPTVFYYDHSRIRTGDFEEGWQSPSFLGYPFIGGEGYTVNMPGNLTLNFTGEPVTRSAVVSNGLPRGATPAASWHLLGNPFAAAIDWTHLTSDAARFSDLNQTLYLFKSTGRYTGTYASYVPGTGTAPGIGVNGGTNVLPLGQACFVRATAAQSGRVTVNLSDLFVPTATPNVQRSTADIRPRLTLALRNAAGTQTHQTAIYFPAGATAGLDDAYDAPLLASAGQPLTLATTSGSEQYSINGQPALTGADVVLPLQLNAFNAGTYILAVDELNALPPGYHAYLRDAQAGTLTDLAATPAVLVGLPAAVRRYAVLFTTQSRVLASAQSTNPPIQQLTIAPNPAHGTATVVLPRVGRGTQPALLRVCNTLGQVVLTRALPATAEALELPLAGLPPGVYTVQARLADGPATGRLVVE